MCEERNSLLYWLIITLENYWVPNTIDNLSQIEIQVKKYVRYLLYGIYENLE